MTWDVFLGASFLWLSSARAEAWKQYAIEQIIKKARIVGAPTNSELKRKQAETRQENGLRDLGKKLRND